MDIENEKKLLERRLQIIEAIEYFKRKEKSIVESLHIIRDVFPQLAAEQKNSVDTVQKCQKKLINLYKKTYDARK